MINIGKKALITGITGQDGSYLSEFLMGKKYEVHGVIRPGGLTADNLPPHLKDANLHEADITDAESINKLVSEVKPDEIYHLASIVEPKILFKEEASILKVNFWSAHHMLHAAKEFVPDSRFYLAGSSMMFGIPESSPQNESTPMDPVTPYGIAKLAAYHLVKMYRVAYGMRASAGILFNHESPRRALHFLPRKITNTAAKIKAGLEKELILGNIEAKRDWGFAGDFVRSMWLMVQAKNPSDYVVGTGELHTVKDILDIAFDALGLDWKKYVKVDQALVRPLETYNIVADTTKIKTDLGWQPEVSFEELILIMLEEDKRICGIR